MQLTRFAARFQWKRKFMRAVRIVCRPAAAQWKCARKLKRTVSGRSCWHLSCSFSGTIVAVAMRMHIERSQNIASTKRRMLGLATCARAQIMCIYILNAKFIWFCGFRFGVCAQRASSGMHLRFHFVRFSSQMQWYNQQLSNHNTQFDWINFLCVFFVRYDFGVSVIHLAYMQTVRRIIRDAIFCVDKQIKYAKTIIKLRPQTTVRWMKVNEPQRVIVHRNVHSEMRQVNWMDVMEYIVKLETVWKMRTSCDYGIPSTNTHDLCTPRIALLYPNVDDDGDILRVFRLCMGTRQLHTVNCLQPNKMQRNEIHWKFIEIVFANARTKTNCNKMNLKGLFCKHKPT